MTYPHRRSEFSGPQFSNCRCGNSVVCWPDVTSVPPLEWGANCPAAMREEIAALRAQVEALKAETNIKTERTMHDHLHTTDIRVGGIYTNGNGLFRRVTGIPRTGSWVDVVYSAYRRDKAGRMVMATIRGRHADLAVGLWSFAEWAHREATEAEAAEVLGV